MATQSHPSALMNLQLDAIDAFTDWMRSMRSQSVNASIASNEYVIEKQLRGEWGWQTIWLAVQSVCAC